MSILFVYILLLFIYLSLHSGGQVGGPCPLEDTWLFQSFDNSWSRLSSCAPPTRFSSFVPLNLQSHNIGLLFGGTQKGPKKVSQV